MTYENLLNPSYCADTDGLTEAKDLLSQGENGPWWYESDATGHNSIIVFSDHFIYVVREALSTDCYANMFEDETPIFFDYVAYVDCALIGGICTGYDTPLEVLVALDKWLYDEIQCLPHPTNQGCGEAEHTWNSCPNVTTGTIPPTTYPTTCPTIPPCD